MFLIWTVAAVTMTLGCEPYSAFTLKRLAVLHQHDAERRNRRRSRHFSRRRV